MKALFGKAFSYDFYALSADEVSNIELPASPTSIYLFEERPTDDEARNNTSGTAIQTVSAWTTTADGYGKRISFSRVDDPDPTIRNEGGSYYYSKKIGYYDDSDSLEREYWIAINSPLEVGDVAQHAPILRSIRLCRVWGQESKVNVTVADLVRLESHLTIHCDYLGDLTQYIDTAEYRVRMKLVGCNVRWGDIVDPEQLNLCIAERALYDFLSGQSRGAGDVAENLSMKHKEEYKDCLKQLYIELDKDRDGKSEGKRNASNPTLEFFR